MESREYDDVRPEDISNLKTSLHFVKESGKFVKDVLKYTYFAPTSIRRFLDSGCDSEEIEITDGEFTLAFSKLFTIAGTFGALSALHEYYFMDPQNDVANWIHFTNPILTNMCSGLYEATRYGFKSVRRSLASEEKQRKTGILEQSRQFEDLLEEDFDERLEN